MVEKEYVLYVRLNIATKDLLRLRAATQRRSLSDYARGLILVGLGKPTPDEAFYLASSTQQNDDYTHSVETGAAHATHTG